MFAHLQQHLNNVFSNSGVVALGGFVAEKFLENCDEMGPRQRTHDLLNLER